jgi:hypothetical protein
MALHDESRRWPKKNETTDWVMMLREARWMSIEEMISMHNELHKLFGADPSDAVIEGERELSGALRMYGIEHRHSDALSDAAGTTVASPVEPTLEELGWYLRYMTVHSDVIKLRQGVEDGGQVFVDMAAGALPEGMPKLVLKSLNKMMPPGIVLKPLPKKPKEEFARDMGAFDLILQPTMRPVMVVPWKELVSSAPESVFKEDKLMITIKEIIKTEEIVLKEGEAPERYMLGPVLVPDEEDTQGEIYSKTEVRKACHWWAEHSGQFSHRHVLQGGEPLLDGEIVMLENYCMPVDCEINGIHIKEGTWMLGGGARRDDIWAKAVAGKLGTWSIGAEALSWMETVEATA